MMNSLSRTLIATILPFSLALWGQAESRPIHGLAVVSPPTLTTIDFGGTLTGFGGTYAGYSDRLTSVSVVSTPGAPCANGDFLIDGNGMLTVNNVPGGTRWNGMTSPADATYLYNNTNTGYGSKSATYNYSTISGPACQIIVSDGTVSTPLAITFTPTNHHVTALNAQSIHSGGPSYHLDTTSSSQLTNLLSIQANDATGLGRQVYLGDTIYGRTSVLNYGATARQNLQLPAMNNVPACTDGLGKDFWLNRSGTCAGLVNITSDQQTTTTDAKGNPEYSGGFEIEDLVVNGYNYSPTGAYPTPIAFNFVNFRGDSTATDAAALVSFGTGGGWGVSFSHGRVYTDPTNTVWLQKLGLALTPLSVSGNAVDVNVDHMSITHVALGADITYPSGSPTGLFIVPHYSYNYVSVIAGDFLDWVATGTQSDHATIHDNFSSVARSTAFNHSDSAQIFPTSQGCTTSTPCYYDFYNNIAVGDDEAPGTSIGDVTPVSITNPGVFTTGLNTTYSPFGSSTTTTLSGNGFGASPGTVVLGASGVTSVTMGANHGGYDYSIGDTFTLSQTSTSPVQTVPGCTLGFGGPSVSTPTTVCSSPSGVVLKVNSLTGTQDFQGGPFQNVLSSTDYFVCNIHNNISLVTFPNGINVEHCEADPANGNAPSVISNNTALNDFMADGGSGSPAGAGNSVKIVTGIGDTVAMDRNLTSAIVKSGGTITSCYPTATGNCGSTSLSDNSQLIAYTLLGKTYSACQPVYTATVTGCPIWAAYAYYLPNWNTLVFGPDTRGLTINMLTPNRTIGAGLGPDGSCLGALCPADNAGVVSWAPVGGGTFDATAPHTPAQ
jgi:hypothetical protein